LIKPNLAADQTPLGHKISEIIDILNINNAELERLQVRRSRPKIRSEKGV
jgi:hypothetical protein